MTRWSSYCRKISKDKSWGDNITLMATAETLNISVSILSFIGGNLQNVRIDPRAPQSTKQVYLLHMPEQHYLPLVKGSFPNGISPWPAPIDYVRGIEWLQTCCNRCQHPMSAAEQCPCISERELDAVAPVLENSSSANPSRKRSSGSKVVTHRQHDHKKADILFAFENQLDIEVRYSPASDPRLGQYWRKLRPSRVESDFFWCGSYCFYFAQLKETRVQVRNSPRVPSRSRSAANKRIPSYGESPKRPRR